MLAIPIEARCNADAGAAIVQGLLQLRNELVRPKTRDCIFCEPMVYQISRKANIFRNRSESDQLTFLRCTRRRMSTREVGATQKETQRLINTSPER